jgi:hypothetical protein
MKRIPTDVFADSPSPRLNKDRKTARGDLNSHQEKTRWTQMSMDLSSSDQELRGSPSQNTKQNMCAIMKENLNDGKERKTLNESADIEPQELLAWVTMSQRRQ